MSPEEETPQEQPTDDKTPKKFSRITDRLVLFIRTNRESVAIFIGASIITISSVVHYLSTMLLWTNPGFNLDDSWIHLQFARTIFEGTPWEYSPGYPATGSTSPLWSIVLSPLFLFTTDPTGLVWGTYIVSTIFYIGCTIIVGRLTADYTESHFWAYFAMVGFVIVPRNTWLILSGMETPLFTFMLILSIYLLDKQGLKYDIALGIVAGLTFLSRPEGIVIILVCVPIRFLIALKRREIDKKRFLSFFALGGTAFLVVLPWILYCLSVTGLPMPDTFYAKVHVPTEFEIEAWNIFWTYFLLEMPFITIGAITGIVLIAKGKPFPWVLSISLTVLYRLSTPYAALINNNRYLVPVFALFMITAIPATIIIFQKIFIFLTRATKERPADILSTHLFVSLIVVSLILAPVFVPYMNQAPFFGNAVKNINEQQVYIGTWLSMNTPEDAVFAIHDAGALRFFSGRAVIDLAGLVSPDIVHSDMNGFETLQYLRNHSCNYFVFFNDLMGFWLGYLPGAVTVLLTVNLDDNVISGRDTMSVYFINWSLSAIP